ncbi:MAG: hypothetical protein HXY19_08185 [Thermoanaerobaculaceae bacterium]|nr:hypothetical protein [Thermoanaerobaculaceae bacterium]
MSQLGALLMAKLHTLRHAVAGVRRESKLKVAFVSVSVALLWLAAFAVSFATFRFLDRFGNELLGTRNLSLSEVLVPRLLSVFALVLLFMLLFSNALLAFATFYRSRETQALAAYPLSGRTVFLSRFVEIVFFASWASAFLGSPVLLAYGLVRHAPLGFYLTALLGYLPFVLIPAAGGAVLAMLAARIVPRLPRPAILLLGAAVLLGAFLLFRAQLKAAQREAGLDVGPLVELAGRAQSPLLPSQWFAGAVLEAAQGERAGATFHLLLLTANGVFAVWLAAEMASALLLPSMASFPAPRRGRRRRAGARALEWLLRRLPAPVRSLSVKDITVFRRDPAQWSQFAIFFGILALYVANMRTSSPKFEQAFWQTFITLANTVASLLVLATLTTRFIFPLVSLEGRRFWLVGLAPLPRRLLVLQKFALASAICCPLTVALVALSSFRLALAPAPFAIAVGTAFVSSFALSGLAVGLGSLYPDFTAEEPARVVSGMGGTLTFIASLVYVILAAGAETTALHWLRHPHGRAWPLAGALACLAVGAVVTTVVPLRLGIRHLERAEF